MELIPSSNTDITGHINKIVETPNELVVNSQLYDKATLKPIPLKFFTMHTTFKHLVLKTRIDWNNVVINQDGGTVGNHYQLQTYCHQVRNAASMIQDKNDTNKFYMIVRRSMSGYDSVMFYALTSVDGVITYVQSVEPYANYGLTWTTNADYRYKNDLHILYETDSYFICERKCCHYDYYTNRYTYRVTEQLLRVAKNNLFSYTSISELWNSDDVLDTSGANCFRYYMESQGEIGYIMSHLKNSVAVYKYDSLNNILTTKMSYSNQTGYNTASNPVKVGDYYYKLIDNYVAADAEPHKYALMKIRLDAAADTVTYEIIPIDIGIYSAVVPRGYILEVVHSMECFNVNGKDYIVFTLHSLPTFNRSPEYHCHVTMRLEATGAVVTDIVYLKDGCRGVLYYVKPTTCVFMLVNAFAFYTFNATTEKYVLTYSCAGIFNTIGFDSTNRFFAQRTDYSVEMLTYASPTILKADFEEEIYNKDTASLETNVVYYAKNFLNEYINVNVNLTIVGDAVFTDNGLKTIALSTSATGTKLIPVTIKGYGRLEVIINQTT